MPACLVSLGTVFFETLADCSVFSAVELEVFDERPLTMPACLVSLGTVFFETLAELPDIFLARALKGAAKNAKSLCNRDKPIFSDAPVFF